MQHTESLIYLYLGPRQRLGSSNSELKEEPSVIEIAKAHACDSCAILLAWGIQSGHSVIPKVRLNLASTG